MSHHTGESTGSGLRGAAGAVHGLGETIRGTINTAADTAVGSDASKNQAIRDRGVDEINTGRYHGTGAGVTPADTAAERHNRAAQGEYPSTTSTGATGLGSSTHNPTTTHTGAYDTTGTTGHTGHTGAYDTTGTTGHTGHTGHTGSGYAAPGEYGHPQSTNAGPHGSNVANKADPRVDSDLDSQRHAGATTGAGYGSTGTGYGHSTAAPTGTGYGNTSTTGTHFQHDDPRSTNAGPHGSNVGNKADPRIDSDYDNRARTGNQTGAAAGPHSSNLANKVDPRVDSDRDNREHRRGSAATAGLQPTGGLSGTTSRQDIDGIDPTDIKGGYTTAETTTGHSGVGGNSGVSGAHGSHVGNNPGSNTHGPNAGNHSSSDNHGPHNSKIANKLDPRVDSDADNRARTGNQTGAAAGPHGSNVANKADPRVDSDLDNRAHHGSTGHTNTYGSTTGATGTHGTTGTHGSTGYGNTSTNHGTHDSNLANKADPRFDSDRDNRAHHGTTGTTGTYGSTTGATGTHGSTGYGNTSTNHGTHDSNVANKADPRFDSDLDNRARTGNQTGAAAGPHGSNVANKADPRVDSDRDNRAHHGTTGVHDTTGTHGVHDTTGTHGTHDTTGAHGTESKHVKNDSATNTTESHPSHGTGIMGKVLDKVDPRVKNA
ncbi:putative period circadian [Diplodia seriata]|uniref:Putative period circadian n=1 Tax=Diplodia seriata TaxID=420778 RepID=A0A0G2GX78_9PEZI|nr:putative period circadian [Diplodia seriata]